MGAQYDSRAVTDSTENAAGVVGLFGNSAVSDYKMVVVFGTTAFRNSDTVPDFYSFYSTDGHNCLGEVRVEFFKNRITDSGRNSGNLTLDDATCGILTVHTFL